MNTASYSPSDGARNRRGARRFALSTATTALPCRCDTIIDGDARSVSIAAASIIAKVTRDRIMRALHDEHPGYGWMNNKGYATEEHREALNRLGPCVHHRRSFAPVYQILCPVDSKDSF